MLGGPLPRRKVGFPVFKPYRPHCLVGPLSGGCAPMKFCRLKSVVLQGWDLLRKASLPPVFSSGVGQECLQEAVAFPSVPAAIKMP